MKRILFFAKHANQIQANANVFDSNNEFVKSSDDNFSVELEVMTKVFIDRGWLCVWSCRDWVDINNGTIQYFNPQSKESNMLAINILSNILDVIVFRIIGSVEGNRNNIIEIIDILQSHFKGLIINHPETMKYGIRKQYIFELQANGFPVIETQYFDKEVSYDALIKKIDTNHRSHIIKPITGELSNSLALIKNDTEIYNVKTNQAENGEAYLRRKEHSIGGWLLQPLIEDIWHGEYQLVFLIIPFLMVVEKNMKKVPLR